MKLKSVVLLFLVTISFALIAQKNDSSEYQIPDSIIQNSQIDYPNQTPNSFEDRINLQTDIQTQKLLKTLFLGGFIFMSLVVIVLIYINNIKIKQILEMIKLQEKQIDLKNFETDKMSVILNSTADAIAIIDINNTILWCNTSFTNLFGFTSDEITNKPIDFFSDTDAQITDLINKAKNEKKPIQFSFSTKNKQNDTIFIQRRIIPIIDKKNNIENFAIIDTDFTALKIALEK